MDWYVLTFELGLGKLRRSNQVKSTKDLIWPTVYYEVDCD